MEYTIKTPNELFSGVVAGTQFLQGTAVVTDETLIPIFETLGYEVIKPAAKRTARKPKAAAKGEK
ncbi:hypothetical protein [Bacillus wiedmannii]|uniref:hypothetical protein n=1 Tax=Bacillus wiedmannii TaxID=1890302 RepID=UPI000BEFCDA3|nr:hypothetical protein [Bacillus wiedmannii]PEM08501.1 hypothetical protein CN610_19810 [Bacillus wiedmannii]